MTLYDKTIATLASKVNRLCGALTLGSVCLAVSSGFADDLDLFADGPTIHCNTCNDRINEKTETFLEQFVRQFDRETWVTDDRWNTGGWFQVGYHSQGVGPNSPVQRFNDYPDHVQLHQAWLYAEKVADGECGVDFGGRIDYLYGTDAPETQAFGSDPLGTNRSWDNGWDNGVYGHALPQLYGELAYNDLSVKFGKFYTIVGYEVPAAPDNFFYSHNWQMNDVEPLTHTGVLVQAALTENTTCFAGYTLGWDSGFEDNGDAFLGGFSLQVNPDFNLTYTTSVGRLNERINAAGNSERGHIHSLTTRYNLTDRWRFISQKNYAFTELEDGTSWRDTWGFTNYWLYAANECTDYGIRFEYWNVDGEQFVGTGNSGNSNDVYALTLGVNCRPTQNVMYRYEVRWDWDADATRVLALNENSSANQTTFGADIVYMF